MQIDISVYALVHIKYQIKKLEIDIDKGYYSLWILVVDKSLQVNLKLSKYLTMVGQSL